MVIRNVIFFLNQDFFYLDPLPYKLVSIIGIYFSLSAGCEHVSSCSRVSVSSCSIVSISSIAGDLTDL